MIARALGEPQTTEEEEEPVTEIGTEQEEETPIPCPLKHPSKILIVNQARIEVLFIKQRIKFEHEKNYDEAYKLSQDLVRHQREIIGMECANVKTE